MGGLIAREAKKRGGAKYSVYGISFVCYCIHNLVIKTYLNIDLTQDEEKQDEEKQPEEKKKAVEDYLPKAHTCSNTLRLPWAGHGLTLPEDDKLFNLYDLAFSNSYFGTI